MKLAKPIQKNEIEALETECELKGAEHKSLQDKLDKLVNEKRGFDMEEVVI